MAKKRANGEGSIRKRADGRWEGRYTAGYHPETGKRIPRGSAMSGKAARFNRLNTANCIE